MSRIRVGFGWWGQTATAVGAESRSPRRNRRGLRPELSQLEERQLLSRGVNPPPIQVDNTNASGPGSLKRAIITADGGGENTIAFAPGLSGQTISIGSELVIKNTKLTITGPAGGITVSGVGPSGNARVFNILQTASVNISNMTITGGYIHNNGGGISNSGTLTLNNCTVTHCTAIERSATYGGGLYNTGTVTLNNCTFSYDEAMGGLVYGEGGGLYNGNGKKATVNNSTFSFDRADGLTGYGGGIYSKPSIAGPVAYNNNYAKTAGANIYP